MIRQRLCWSVSWHTHTANWSDTNKQQLATLICSWTVSLVSATELLPICCWSNAQAHSPQIWISTDSDMLIKYFMILNKILHYIHYLNSVSCAVFQVLNEVCWVGCAVWGVLCRVCCVLSLWFPRCRLIMWHVMYCNVQYYQPDFLWFYI